MADKLTIEQRRTCMSHIRSKNTKPEMLVRHFLFAHGYRYRLHVKKLPGTPDIVLHKYKTVIFVNGCFWHGHEGCKLFVWPKSNVDFWMNKIRRNQERDMEERIMLRRLGWHVIVMWECQLKPKVRKQNLEGLSMALQQILLKEYGLVEKQEYIDPTEECLDIAAEPLEEYGLKQ